MCFQDSSRIIVPPFGTEPGSKSASKWNAGTWASGQGSFGQGSYKTGIYKSDIQNMYSGQYDNQFSTQQFNRDYHIDSGMDSRFLTQNSSFLHNWQTNGRYLQQVKMPVLFGEESEAGLCVERAPFAL